jgi:hypothetical protein
MSAFDDLVAEGDSVPTAGWDFSWFEGRASEQRPSWGYATLLADHPERTPGTRGHRVVAAERGHRPAHAGRSRRAN